MQRSRLVLGSLLALGLILRIALGWFQPEDLLTDTDGYLAHAKPVAAGWNFYGPYTGRPTAFRPPAYPVMLGMLMACGLSDAVAVIAVNCVSFVVTVLLTHTLALQHGIDRHWSMLAIAGVILDPLLLRYSVLPMTEVPCAAILLAAVVSFRQSCSFATVGDHRSAWFAVLAGAMFGVGTLLRPVVMIVCVFVTLHAVWRYLNAEYLVTARSVAAESTSSARGLFSLFLPAIIAGLVLSPWVIRNALQFHHFIPATTHGGYTLALGNNADFYRDVINGTDEFPWDGTALDAWQKRMIRESEDQGILATDEPAADAWYYSQAAAAIRSDPRSFGKATALRLSRFWAISMAAPSAGQSVSKRLIMAWYVILWIGLVLQICTALAEKKSPQDRSMAMLWLVILAFLVMHSVYWTDTRMRAPLMPIIIVISVSGWQSVSTRFIGRFFRLRTDGRQ